MTAVQNTVRLTVFHTSDEHGHIENAGRVARIVEDARKQNPGGVVYVSSGDYFTGSSAFELLGTQPSVDIANASQTAEMALGDHDFAPGDRSWKPGEDFMGQWMGKFKPHLVAANVVDSAGQQLAGTTPFDVTTLKGIKLGWVGLTTPNTANIIPPEQMNGITFTDPVAAGRKAVDALHQQGVNTVFVLSHLEDSENAQVAKHIPDLQILGGHTHTAWQQPQDFPPVAGVSALPPGRTGLRLDDELSHPGCYRQSLTRVDLDVDPTTGKTVAVHYSLVPVDPKGPEDTVVAPLVHQYEAEMQKKLDEPVGTLDRPLHHDDAEPDQIDPIMTHVMLEATNADVAVINKKYVRQSLAGGVETRGAMIDAIPFNNALVSGHVTVGELNHMLADSLRRHDQTSLAWQFAGGKLGFKDGAIVDAASGQPLPTDRKLKLATDDYLLVGGLDYLPRNQYTAAADAPNLRDVFSAALAREGSHW